MLIKNSIIYLSSSILNKSIPFLLLPVMTKYLTPEEYGTLSIYLIMVTIYSAFIGMSIHTNVSKLFFKVTQKELSIYLGNILYILLVSVIIYFLISCVVAYYYDSIFSIPTNWILLIPFISLTMMINELNTTILRNEQRAYMFGIFEISNTALQMGITMVLLLSFSMNWYSQILGILISGIIFFIIGIYYMYYRKYISMSFNPNKIKEILSISLPLIPHVLGNVIIAMSDRLFIEKMVSLEAVGIYSVGYMFGMVVLLFTDAFIKAWSPWFYKNLAQPTESKKQKIVKYTYIYIIGIFILAIFISLIGKLILPYFVDEKFYEASEYILWISLGYAVHGVYKIFFPYLVHMSKTSFLAVSTVTAAVLNLIFNYIFINEYGTIGAAYATIVAFLVSSFMVFWYQKKNFSMPWRLQV